MSHAYVINLDWAMCRWKRASEQLDELDVKYTRVSAVDGADIDKNELMMHIRSKGILYRWIRDITHDEVGCCLSHRKVWEMIARGNDPGGYVFEDDFVADVDLPVVMDAIDGLRIDHPVLIKLYVPSFRDSWFYGSKMIMIAPLTGVHSMVLQTYVQWGTVAYYVNRAGAERLVNRVKYMHRPIDDIVRRTWETGVTVLNVLPSPVGHDGYPSIIGQSRRLVQQSANRRMYLRAFNTEFAAMSVASMAVGFFRFRQMFRKFRS